MGKRDSGSKKDINQSKKILQFCNIMLFCNSMFCGQCVEEKRRRDQKKVRKLLRKVAKAGKTKQHKQITKTSQVPYCCINVLI